MSAVKLRELAHSRTGDKGDTSNISVIAFKAEDYSRLRDQLTAERVAAHFAQLLDPKAGSVRRYELPNVQALNFVLPGILKGGVTRSLALDAHGKALGAALLDIEIEP
ncbi:MAG: AtuA-related protein [Pseudomonas sp.]|uniref:AtuA-related protein n=1 Tax=Pseudomonas sp. TaxID=306 RepID=UPI003D6E272E